MNPLVSIIIPTYNREESLKYTVESVLNQTFEDFELLICDDGSTDETRKMIENFSDARIKWISGDNSGGPAVPRNRGIKASQSEWLAFLDSDDLWLPEKLERQIESIDRHHVLAVCTNAKVMKNHIILDDSYFMHSQDKLLTFNDMLKVNHVICSSMIIHKSIVQSMNGFAEGSKFRIGEDYVLWMSAAMLTNIYYLSDPLVVYRDEAEASIRGKPSDNKKEGIIKEIHRHNNVLYEVMSRIKYANAGYMNYVEKIIKQMIKNYIRYFYIKYWVT